MSKTKSGVILILVGIGMNLIGWFVADQSWGHASSSPALAGFIALLMVASLVVGLFGLFRFIVGLLSRKKQPASIVVAPPRESVWPPAPKPPDAD